jgi:hypothetical protein
LIQHSIQAAGERIESGGTNLSRSALRRRSASASRHHVARHAVLSIHGQPFVVDRGGFIDLPKR